MRFSGMCQSILSDIRYASRALVMSGHALLVTSMIAVLVTAQAAQSPSSGSGAQFDVVSIKPHKNEIGAGGGMRTLPDGPVFVTALQEQLGLKLRPEKTRVPIFIVDHIERPTPNDR